MRRSPLSKIQKLIQQCHISSSYNFVCYVATAAPGKTNDAQAIQAYLRFQYLLQKLHRDFDIKNFISVDNAYKLLDLCLVAFPGEKLMDESGRRDW